MLEKDQYHSCLTLVETGASPDGKWLVIRPKNSLALVRTGSLHLLPSLGRKKWAIDLIKSSLGNGSVLMRCFWEEEEVFIPTSLQVLVSPWAQWVALLGWVCAPSMEWSHLWHCLCRTVLSALTLMLFSLEMSSPCFRLRKKLSNRCVWCSLSFIP